jgi:hypothetical protein
LGGGKPLPFFKTLTMKDLLLALGSIVYFILFSVPLAICVLTTVYTIYFLKDLIHVGQQTKLFKTTSKIFKNAFTSASERVEGNVYEKIY